MKESYETRQSRAKGIYGAGQKRVAATPEPKGQKFPCGSRVHIAADLSHFPSGKDATVNYVYCHAYGGSNVKSYSLDVDGHGSVSWYEEDQLTAICKHGVILYGNKCLNCEREKKRNTAARLDRFEKADRFGQRRVEENFAMNAACVAENNRAERSKTNLRDCKLLNINIESTNLLTPENITKEFHHQPINKQLYHKAVYYNEMIAREEQAGGETTDELLVCRLMLGNVFSMIPDHFKNDNTIVCRPDFLNSAIHNIDCEIKFDFPETEKESPAVPERCEHDLPSHICAVCNWVDEPILTQVKTRKEVEAQNTFFADNITGGPGNELDKIGRLQCLDRLNWIKKPEIESWKFRYDPAYFEDEKIGNLWHVRWNYEETDSGLRERTTSSFEAYNKQREDFLEHDNFSPVPGELHSMTMNGEPFEPSHGRECPEPMAIKFDNLAVAIRKLGRAIMKELEPIIVPCCDFMLAAINEVKDAFPFFFGDLWRPKTEPECFVYDMAKAMTTSGHIERTERLKILSNLYGVKRYPFEPNWILTKRILKTIRG